MKPAVHVLDACSELRREPKTTREKYPSLSLGAAAPRAVFFYPYFCSLGGARCTSATVEARAALQPGPTTPRSKLPGPRFGSRPSALGPRPSACGRPAKAIHLGPRPVYLDSYGDHGPPRGGTPEHAMGALDHFPGRCGDPDARGQGRYVHEIMLSNWVFRHDLPRH